MTKRLISLCLFTLLLSAEVMAQPTSEAMAAEVTDNVATEYAECAAFFSIVHGAFLSSGKQDEAERFKEAYNKAAMFSLLASKQSRAEEMATKVTLARIEISMKDMQNTIENNYSNISLLTNKHLSTCIDVMNDSAPLIQRWTDRVQKKYEKK